MKLIKEDIANGKVAVFLQTDGSEATSHKVSQFYFEQMCYKSNLNPAIYLSETGKPIFAQEDYHFNISHSGKYWAAGIAQQPIGVDIELWSNEYLIENIRTELNIKSLRDWCAKEAIIKCLDVPLDEMVHIKTFIPFEQYYYKDASIYVKEITISSSFCGFVACTHKITKLLFFRNELTL